ncbi:MAG TPA: hypothetical protein VJ728_18175 [Candidatus Binataceae bacterium]|nr:hypothetical protein [Candidatus Binataceae bacterium]
MLPTGIYAYEIRLNGALIASEECRFDAVTISASQRSADGLSRRTVEAALDSEHRVHHITLSYSSSLFTRKARYEAVEGNLRGRISGLSSRNEVVVTLGRYREVDPGFLIFRALIIAHMRSRGEQRWTGRVAVIDPNTLAAASFKQTCTRHKDSEFCWIYEPRMGDAEQIELDDAGRIVRRRDNRGATAELISGGAAC